MFIVNGGVRQPYNKDFTYLLTYITSAAYSACSAGIKMVCIGLLLM